MEFKINIPDELVGSFKTVAETLTKVVNEAEKTAETVKKDVLNEIDSFNKEAYKEATKEIYKDIKDSLKDIEETVTETVTEKVTETATSLDEILRDLFQSPQPTEAEIKHEAHKKEVITKLYEQVKYVVPENADWFKDQVNSGKFEDIDEAVLQLTIPAVLYHLFDWEKSPQGYFLWKSVYKEIGGTEEC